MHMKSFVFGALGTIAALILATPAMAQAGCTRERLKEIADQYRAAQASGSIIMNMRPMGEWVNYNENFELSSMAITKFSHGIVRLLIRNVSAMNPKTKSPQPQ